MGLILALEDVHKSFAEGDALHPVLRGVSARVGSGELVALLGPSGSGKSTLLNIISGIDSPDSGTVTIEGIDLTALSERDRTLLRRTRIGFIFQFFNLLPTLTVEDNLLLPLELNGRLRPAAQARALGLLERVGLGSRADSYPDRLSGGEQQRVAIARALVHEPALILADEPTGNLDAETGAVVLDLFEELIRAEGRTALIVTHSPDVVARADRVLHMRSGLLVEQQ